MALARAFEGAGSDPEQALSSNTSNSAAAIAAIMREGIDLISLFSPRLEKCVPILTNPNRSRPSIADTLTPVG
jgi:hypothetical protein